MLKILNNIDSILNILCGTVSGARVYFLVLWVFFFVTSGTSWCAMSIIVKISPQGETL